ncbi:hypothetical protein AZE42_05167 [Rhizopogon vesiculosus]|uniref:RRM domain-containing protein n=1 Tax=Rhizopogon vesiculosus TaxID=180088 RepID=A0A1J8QB81_9AGAM|nr:hypothetical protein AZE42_05167 [Rhizopogon vesiculosus]
MSIFERDPRECATRSPRLQPSPSLPNLRPSPREMATSRHVTRPPPKSQPSSSNVKDGTSCCPKTYSRKTHATTTHYLTPPLTPSSSLQSDSTDHESTDPIILSADLRRLTLANSASESNQHSRFLIIGNAPSDLSEDDIRQYFKSLTSTTVTAPSTWSTPSVTRRLPSKPIQTIFRRSPENRDFIVAFYDIRDAEHAKHIIESKASKRLKDGTGIPPSQAGGNIRDEALTCCLADSGYCADLLGDLSPSVMTQTEGTVVVSVKDTSPTRDFSASRIRTRTHFTVQVKVRSILGKYGELRNIFLAEYYDVRDADAAWGALDGHVVDSMELRVFSRSPLRDHLSEPQKESSCNRECEIGGEHPAEPKTPTVTTYLSQPSQATSNSIDVPFPVLNDIGAGVCYPEREHPVSDSRDSSAGFQALKDRRRSAVGLDDLLSVHRDASTDVNVIDNSIAPGQYGRRSSNHLLFDSTRRAHQKEFDAGHNRKHSMYDHEPEVSDTPGHAPVVTGTVAHPEAQTYYSTEYYHRPSFEVNPIQPPWVSSPPIPNPISMAMQYPASPMSTPPVYWDPVSCGWVTFQSPSVLEPWAMYPSSHYYPQPQPSHPVAEYPFPYVTTSTLQPGIVAARPPSLAHSSSRVPPEGNQLDIRKIELGIDMRTTVMVKNIPNKMTDKELITYINKVCPRKIDFLYLRMDFQNGCNVGYAFVNFISVQDLLRFAKARLNEKWNIYSSEKVLQMSYANYQGKEALVEKFKNSCIMDEREEWRPKIFYSDAGPNQGLPEEFPKPTHIRRKERSSYNRGTLYPPGVSTGAGHYRYLDAGSRQQPPRAQVSAEDKRRRRGAAESVSFHSAVGVEPEDTARAG